MVLTCKPCIKHRLFALSLFLFFVLALTYKDVKLSSAKCSISWFFFFSWGGWGFLHHPRLSPFHLDFHINQKKKSFLTVVSDIFPSFARIQFVWFIPFFPCKDILFFSLGGREEEEVRPSRQRLQEFANVHPPHQLAFKSLRACALVKTFGGKKVKTWVAKPGVGLKQRRLASAISVDATTTSSSFLSHITRWQSWCEMSRSGKNKAVGTHCF